MVSSVGENISTLLYCENITDEQSKVASEIESPSEDTSLVEQMVVTEQVINETLDNYEQEDFYAKGNEFDDAGLNNNCSSRESGFLSHLKMSEIIEDENEFDLNYSSIGLRCVDVGYVMSQAMQASADNNHVTGCAARQWKVINVVQKGIKTFVNMKCVNCCGTLTVKSHEENNTLDPNYKFVAGCMAAGIGYSNIEEFNAAQGIPTMSAKTFRKFQEQVDLDAIQISKECMEETAKKERELAIKKGHVINGIPYITVITDASWAKRAMGGNYDSLGGCAAVIGYETGELIDVTVKMKACATCDRTAKENRRPTSHICFKNFVRSRSSGAMEQEAITEAFNSSVEKYGLIYKCKIGDGDSSVMANLQKHNPHKKYGVEVKKIECSNHLYRNLCHKLEAICKTPNRNTSQARAILKNTILKIRVEMRTAAEIRREDISLDMKDKLELLFKDIMNFPSHVFGQHKDYCKLNWPCEESSENDEETMQLLVASGIYEQVKKLLRDVGKNVESFLYNVTNNRCEWFNNLTCKTIGGKRIDFTKRTSYPGRCALAALQNTRKGALSSLYKGLNERVPEILQKMERRRLLEVSRNKTYDYAPRNIPCHKQANDVDYGFSAEKPDVSDEIMKNLVLDLENTQKENQKNKLNIFLETLN